MGSISDRKCTRFQSVKMTDWKLVHWVPWRLAKEWNLGSFHSVNFSDWKHVRFHSMALSDGLLLQNPPVCEVDGPVQKLLENRLAALKIA
jgi:hypothetical protein